MNRLPNRTIAARKASWLRTLEIAVTAARPELAGKIDWNTATCLFNQGKTVTEALLHWTSLPMTGGKR